MSEELVNQVARAIAIVEDGNGSKPFHPALPSFTTTDYFMAHAKAVMEVLKSEYIEPIQGYPTVKISLWDFTALLEKATAYNNIKPGFDNYDTIMRRLERLRFEEKPIGGNENINCKETADFYKAYNAGINAYSQKIQKAFEDVRTLQQPALNASNDGGV